MTTVGEPVERCPWWWELVQDMLDEGDIELRKVGHCPWCGGFFDRDEGWPRKRIGMGGRRFGTEECEQAWQDDQAIERRGQRMTREMIQEYRNGSDR
jgi:hypothetical protein